MTTISTTISTPGVWGLWKTRSKQTPKRGVMLKRPSCFDSPVQSSTNLLRLLKWCAFCLNGFLFVPLVLWLKSLKFWETFSRKARKLYNLHIFGGVSPFLSHFKAPLRPAQLVVTSQTQLFDLEQMRSNCSVGAHGKQSRKRLPSR